MVKPFTTVAEFKVARPLVPSVVADTLCKMELPPTVRMPRTLAVVLTMTAPITAVPT